MDIRKAVEAILSKVDKDNEEFIKTFDDLTSEQKEIALKGLNELERKLQAFFVAQKKEYLKAVRELPTYLNKRSTKRKAKVKKADAIPERVLEQFSEIILEFIFANDKHQVEKLEEIYAAYADSVFPGIAEICARSVEKSQFSPGQSLTDKAVKWLENHKIKFAQEVNQATHNAVIKTLRDSLIGANGVISSAEELVQVLPDYFGQAKLKEKKERLSNITDVDLFNRLSKEIDKQECFEHYRARRIARTETIATSNAATLEGWRQSDVIAGKQWVCAMTQNSRKAHKKANGQIVPLDEPFIVGGEKLMHPGDSSMGASAENVINCRCTMKSVLKYKMRKEQEDLENSIVKSVIMPIAKVDSSSRMIIGVVYKASKMFDANGKPLDAIDSHGNWATEEEVKKACHKFNKKLQEKKLIGKVGIDKQHNEKPGYGVVVESYITMVDIPEINASKGDWVAAVEVTDDECWKEIEKGDIEGFSIGGTAKIDTSKGGEKNVK